MPDGRCEVELGVYPGGLVPTLVLQRVGVGFVRRAGSTTASACLLFPEPSAGHLG